MTVLDQFLLSGRTALVTGSRRGIGRAAAVALAEAGANIVGVSATLDTADSQVARQVEATGRSFRAYQCDLGNRQALQQWLDQLQQEVPRIDILLANAGTILRAPAAEHSDDYWTRVLEVNLTSQFVLARHVGRQMLEHGYGKIIFTSSLLSFQGGINVPSYAASKGGIGQLTMALANEWAGRGVNVNAIAPGYIQTDNTRALQDDPVRSQQILGRIPAGRWGRPEDLAGAVVFLASDAAAYIHGTTLVVDGGWLGR